MDTTEAIRRHAVGVINSEVQSQDKDAERKRLEAQYGQVWTTDELGRDFVVKCFMAPFVVVVRKSDKKEGTLTFQHSPRFYFEFQTR